MFTGIVDVDWASMGHAYTESATDVPGLLWGLASDDPAQREIALDGMYGAVHHQGDVYDSTVACIPFLFELVTTPTVADRGAIVGLLGSIAGRPEDDDEEPGDLLDLDEDDEWFRPSRDARQLVRSRADAFLELLDDPAAELRAAVPGVLAQLHPDPARVFAALRDRLPVEQAPQAVRNLARALGTLAVKHTAALGADAGRTLRDIVSGTVDPELRMTALAQLARCAPDRLPEDTVEIALEVMRHAREDDGTESPEPERPRTDTMISYLRELEAERRQNPDIDEADELLAELHWRLGDRTDLRFPLLVGQLHSPEPSQRSAAVEEAGRLLTGWRAPDDEPVLALARLLAEDDLRLNKEVLTELRYLAPIAHCAVAGVEAYVEASGDRPLETDTPFANMALGLALEVLTLQGDGRVVAALTSILEVVEVPERLQRWMEALGPEAAAPLGPVLHERLAALDPREPSDARDRLLTALGVLAPAESLPLVLDVLRGTPSGGWPGAALGALCGYGDRAAEAAPLLRELLADDATRPEVRTQAAEALWAVAPDAGTVLPALQEGLRAERQFPRSVALRLTRALGPAASPVTPRLHELMACEYESADAATALWKVTGSVDDTLPVLLDAWTRTPRRRPDIAACLREMGLAAAPALPLIRAELASPRRHTNDGTTGNVRYEVASDVALLEDCRSVLDLLEG
ncbi:HEAT repeat domain-containing protein [Streptomyces sp. NPDC001795]|uniref:HEAT repeat domain-containing protein n=1 Tax=unclassified Streptomyces TaxID=2593676 RepID=UPI003330174B